MNRSRHDFGRYGPAGTETGEPIAIIGAACRLPGAPDLDSFWQLLIDGTDAVTEIPDDRWNKAQLFHPDRGHRGKAYTFAAGVLGDVSRFDAGFFGISPREAAQMDPQQRLLLELAYETFEDAGVDAATIAGRAVGVFVGGSSWDYLNINIGDPSTTDAYSMIGVTLCSLANRISYAFDLRGPSFTVDTACSSSLVALHQACEALRGGRIESALVGGVSLLLAPQSFIGFCAASMLSPRGRCHAFDARADGYVRAEGGGVVMLKPLSAALADGDPIRAVIRGTGVNSDGRTTGLSLPNREAQAALLDEVYGRFGIDPEDLSYLEAHGTGTPAGDPIEAGALGEKLGQRRSRPLTIGSVKTNIGHLEAGSGMAGLLKAMLVAERGIIPPSLHNDTPNPNIPFETLNLALAKEATPLPAGQRIVGVNSFGFGGTNAHAVVEALPAPQTLAPDAPDATLPPLLLSAQSEEALRRLAGDWREILAAADPAALPALLRGVAHHRTQHMRRLVVPAAAPDEMAAALDAFTEGRAAGLAIGGSAVQGKVGFVFSGNGSQWAGMAADALRGSPEFRAALDEVDAAVAPRLGWSVIEALEAADPDRLRNTEIAQPLLFAVQVALVTALRAHGVEAEGCMGHSVGEVAAAWAAGALDLADAARVIAARSHAQQARHGIGAMGVLGLDLAATMAALASETMAGSGIEIAAHNGSQSTTIAGSSTALTLLEVESERRGWRFTRLDLDYAFHSAAMDPIRADLAQSLDGLAAQATSLPFYSTVSGAPLDGTELGADYWWRNVREPVQFAEAARAMVADGFRIFVEFGPHPVVQAYLNDALRAEDRAGRVLPTLSRRPARHDPIAAIAARVHAAGGDIRRAPAFVGPSRLAELPRYPWQRERFWVARTGERTDRILTPFEHPLLGQRLHDQPDEWERHIGLETQTWIADHAVGGAAVMPAAALIDMALAAARARRPGATTLELLDIEIGRAMVLEPGIVRDVRFRIGSGAGDFELRSRPRLSEESWIVHMSGRIAESEASAPIAPVPQPHGSIARVSGASLYALAGRLGLDYGPAFQVVRAIDVMPGDRGLVDFERGPSLGQGFLLPPNLLDGALQGLLALAADRLGEDMAVLPWRFGRIRLIGAEGARPASARIAVTRVGPRSVRADVVLLDSAGVAIAELADCWFVRVAFGRAARPEEQFFHPVRIASMPAAGASALADAMLPIAAGAADAQDSGLLADAYVSAIAAETLSKLTKADSGTLAPQDLFRTGRVAPTSRVLLDQLLRWLATDGLAEHRADGAWHLSTDDLPSSAEILRTLFYDGPRGVADAALLALAGDALPTLLREGPSATPELPGALWEQFLGESPSGEAAAQALADMVVALAAATPTGRPLRILEIGARRGGFTQRLLRAIEGHDVRLVVATSPDDQPPLADELARLPHAKAIAWMPGEPLDEPPFDLIVGMHALSLADDGGRNLAAARATLAPGGLLMAAEPAPNRLWQFLRPFAQPPIDGARWTTLLERAGFEQTSRRPMTGGLWPVCLVTARASKVVKPGDVEESDDASFLLVSADADPLAQAIKETLEGAGRTVLGLTFDSLSERIAAWPAENAPALALVFAPKMPLPRRLAAIAALANLPADTPVAATLIARAAAEGDPEGAALMGARRVLANEAAQITTRYVRLDPALDDTEAAARATAELLAPDAEGEVAWSPTGRSEARVRAGLPIGGEAKAPAVLRLAIERPGLLDSLGWGGGEPTKPGVGEIAIDVAAAGLNFRDVMWAMGLLPDEALLDGFAGPTLGLECAGVVTAVGPGVKAFARGDRVMAFAPASLSTHTVTAAHAVMRMPADLDFASAATVPVAFLTVAYALGHLARVGPDDLVLIHGGAGGVGLAAIQYARHRGARVIATAGSAAKRALLRSLGVEAVFDSRSLSFADDVLRLTGGAGVDVVLNSLSGEAMRRSLGLVKPFGRFLELGKRDFYENSAVGLRPFRHNVSYFGIDADQLPLRQPALAAALFDEIGALFAEGALRPLPHRTFDYRDAERAFRLMQSSGHIGKIVLEPGAALPVPIPTAPVFVASDDGAYVITGGLDGFGREAAFWLARHGARKIALLSRRGPAAEGVEATLAAFAELGAEARAYAVDVADAAKLKRTLAKVRNELGSIAGVVHAAVAMDDAMLGQLDEARFAAALAPKLAGADALDRLTRDDPVSLFLLFSSVTTPLGNPGQGNYVAANAAIEAVAERRHAEGLPALAVQWGPIADAGYLVRESQVSDILAKQLGGAHLSAAEALNRLPALLAAGIPIAGVATVRWGAMRSRLPLLASTLFDEIGASASADAGEIDLRAMLADLSPDAARERVTGLLVEEVARIMKLAPDRVEPQRPLAELGMDSLMAVELRLAVEQRFGIAIPLLALSEGATLSAMASRIIRGLGSSEEPAQDDVSRLTERLTLHEGQTGPNAPADVLAPPEPGFAAAAAVAP